MRFSLVLAVLTWCAALLLRGYAKVNLDTLENARGPIAPPLSWMASPSTQLTPLTTIGVLVLVLLLLLAWWRLQPTALAALGLGLFVGGGAANTTEQIVFGAVLDYIPIPWSADYQYLANLADVAVVAGTFLSSVALFCAARPPLEGSWLETARLSIWPGLAETGRRHSRPPARELAPRGRPVRPLTAAPPRPSRG